MLCTGVLERGGTSYSADEKAQGYNYVLLQQRHMQHLHSCSSYWSPKTDRHCCCMCMIARSPLSPP